MKKFVFFITLFAILLLGTGSFIYIKGNSEFFKSKATTSTSMTVPEKDENAPVVQTATIAAIGDILLHQAVLDDAKLDDGRYDFDKQFAEIQPLLQEPDFLIANQESIPGGADLGATGYPTFNSPFEIVDTAKKSGIDLLSFANNHAFDRQEKALLSAIAYAQKVDMPYVGAHESVEDQDSLRIFEVNGIKLGVIAYTYDTNGPAIPDDKQYLVNLIDKERMAREIERIKPEVDVTIAVMHWGVEYQREPSEAQKETAQFLADQGVEIIFGSHPHVLQPIEWLTGVNGQKTLVVYSLGNFISNQRESNVGTLYSELGGIVQVTVTKTITGSDSMIEIGDVQFQPTYVAMNKDHTDIRVIPMLEAPAFGRSTPTNDEMIDFMLGNLGQ